MARLNHAGRASFISAVVMLVLATAAVILRLGLRRQSKTNFAADDVLIVVGLIGFGAWTGVLFWGESFALSCLLDIIDTNQVYLLEEAEQTYNQSRSILQRCRVS